ncbi:MAG TPA: hypothetical protein VLF89_09040 [Candidatus Saccharimonadales bacterium]|nr:hypothetical protein [Candidatus Saccharimonadales bacterium]
MTKKILTKKQQTILTLILTFRFINSKQIQQFLEHKDHRRINAWLKDITEKQYVIRDYTPIYGTLTKPAVYSLAALGRQYIRETFHPWDTTYLKRLRDDVKRSKAFRVKCQLIADCCLIFFAGREKELIDTIQEILTEGVILKEDVFQFFTPAFYSELEYDFPLLSQLKPDAYMYHKTETGIDHSCFYAIDAYVPRLTLQYMLKNIFHILSNESWENDSIGSLQCYIICPSNMVIIYLRRLLKSFLERYYGSTPILFHFATRNQLYKWKKDKSKKIGWITVSSQ